MADRAAMRLFRELHAELGFPQRVCMESFSGPNFELTAEILDSLVHRYDQTANLSDDISTESHRVAFIKSVVLLFGSRSRLQLDARKLYAADTAAVKEMLRALHLLCYAQWHASTCDESTKVGETSNDSEKDPTSGEADSHSGGDVMLASKLHDVKNARAMSFDLLEGGATLYKSLGIFSDPVLREKRSKALRFLESMSLNLDSSTQHRFLEQSIRRATEEESEGLKQVGTTCVELQKDMSRMDIQNKKKRQEVERMEKRLRSLQTVKPAFLGEFEKYEQDLIKSYDLYLQTYRNLDFLEQELDLLNTHEQERLEENQKRLKKMQKKLREEEWRLLRGDNNTDPSPVSPTSLILHNRQGPFDGMNETERDDTTNRSGGLADHHDDEDSFDQPVTGSRAQGERGPYRQNADASSSAYNNSLHKAAMSRFGVHGEHVDNQFPARQGMVQNAHGHHFGGEIRNSNGQEEEDEDETDEDDEDEDDEHSDEDNDRQHPVLRMEDRMAAMHLDGSEEDDDDQEPGDEDLMSDMMSDVQSSPKSVSSPRGAALSVARREPVDTGNRQRPMPGQQYSAHNVNSFSPFYGSRN
eukprot:GHVQ01026830.1.p1 GENE.GHVQ01026830.1~~GHVQ01026830.1.p1  ORF type:complete len:584 (+),score=91.62 GHVQ01026830.1:4736-6487(+)